MPVIEVDLSLPGARVIRVLERLAEEQGLPEAIRVDNGTKCKCFFERIETRLLTTAAQAIGYRTDQTTNPSVLPVLMGAR